VSADRRALLRLAAACALAPARAGRALGHEPGAERFAPPTGPLRYTRRLVRNLRGGYRLAVSRSFAVRFEPRPAGGYALAGEQLAVEVAAPERMAPFAELERQRIETGLFPLQLDTQGRIVAEPDPRSSDLLDRAVADARRLLDERAASATERAEADAFVQLVHQVGAGLSARLPEDLFAPASHRRVEHRAIELPGSATGLVEVVFTADADPRTGLMRQARREIVTTIDDDRRTTEEDWTLAPL
jgi:hypothetical protein